MKVNLKKASAMVLAVGMMSTLSLTAFGANALPLAEVLSTNEVKVGAEMKAAETTEAIQAVEVSKGAPALALQDYDVEEQADGSYKMKNKKTGETVIVSFASGVEVQKNDGSLKQAITVTQTIPKK